MKILAIKFKQLGDVAIMVPALRAMREYWPDAEIHVLVEELAVPLLRHLPWIQKVWGLPRSRGNMRLRQTLPLISQLRKERYDRTIDFVGNDRGAIISALIGAPERVGLHAPKGFFGRRFCYSKVLEERTLNLVIADLYSVEHWGVPFPSSLNHEIHSDPDLKPFAEAQLPDPNTILCHISASMPKREWPIGWWAEIDKRCRSAGIPIFFSAGPCERDQSLLADLKTLSMEVQCLPKTNCLGEFLAIIARAGMFVGSDSGPLHFAVGLGTTSIGMYGPMLPDRVAPLSGPLSALVGGPCDCDCHARVCISATPCFTGISIDRLWKEIEFIYSNKLSST